MRRILSFLMALGLMICMIVLPASAAQPELKLTLVLDGELQVGKTVTAELRVEENPGVAGIQFALGYDRTVLKCTDCYVGVVLDGMVKITNPNHADGAFVAAASATPVNNTGVLAEFTFEVLGRGDPMFQLVGTRFVTDENQTIPFVCSISGLEQTGGGEGTGSTAAQQPQEPDDPPEQDELSQDPPAESGSTGSTGGTAAESQPTTTPEQPEQSGKEEPAFTDIEGHWAQDYLTTAKERNLVAGYPDGRCGPNDPVTRAQFVMILYKNAGLPKPVKASDFVDLEPGGYYLDAVAWAQEKGYVAGKGEGRFAPDDPVSREEIAVILRKLPQSNPGMEQMFAGMYDGHFTDSDETSSWAKSAVYWAVYNEIWCGKSGIKMGSELKATQYASRAEVAVMMVNYQDNVEG